MQSQPMCSAQVGNYESSSSQAEYDELLCTESKLAPRKEHACTIRE